MGKKKRYRGNTDGCVGPRDGGLLRDFCTEKKKRVSLSSPRREPGSPVVLCVFNRILPHPPYKRKVVFVYVDSRQFVRKLFTQTKVTWVCCCWRRKWRGCSGVFSLNPLHLNSWRFQNIITYLFYIANIHTHIYFKKCSYNLRQ